MWPASLAKATRPCLISAWRRNVKRKLSDTNWVNFGSVWEKSVWEIGLGNRPSIWQANNFHSSEGQLNWQTNSQCQLNWQTNSIHRRANSIGNKMNVVPRNSIQLPGDGEHLTIKQDLSPNCCEDQNFQTTCKILLSYMFFTSFVLLHNVPSIQQRTKYGKYSATYQVWQVKHQNQRS